MDMITVKQAAEKWGLSARYVQVLCKNGKLPGAVKFGLNWMIPYNMERPKDRRYKENKLELKAAPKIVMPVQSPMIIMSSFYKKTGDVEECMRSLAATPETAALFEGEIAFAQGDIEKALQLVLPLLQVESDFYGTLNVGMITMALASWKNDRELWKIGRDHISNVSCANESEGKVRDLWLNITDSVMFGETKELNDLQWVEFDEVTKDSIPMYQFYYAKHIYRIGVEVARGKVIVPEIYLHFLCADAYDKIGLKEKSEQHLDIAVSLSLPDKLYGVLAEYKGLMSTELDKCLERKDPEAAKIVKRKLQGSRL